MFFALAVAQLVGALSHTSRGCRFDPRPGHVLRLWDRSLAGAHTRGKQSTFLSHINVFPSLSLSLKSNKHILWIKKNTHGFICISCTYTHMHVLVFSIPSPRITDHVQECLVTAADLAAATLVSFRLAQNVKRPWKPILDVLNKSVVTLTKAMSMCGHRWHHAPGFCFGVVAFYGIQSLQSVSSSDHIQLVIQHCDAELQPPPIHICHRSPHICTKIILFNACCSLMVINKSYVSKNFTTIKYFMKLYVQKYTFISIDNIPILYSFYYIPISPCMICSLLVSLTSPANILEAMQQGTRLLYSTAYTTLVLQGQVRKNYLSKKAEKQQLAVGGKAG